MVALLPGILALCSTFPSLVGSAPPPHAGPGIEILLADPILWLTALALLFDAPMEATMAAWAMTYLGEKRVSETIENGPPTRLSTGPAAA